MNYRALLSGTAGMVALTVLATLPALAADPSKELSTTALHAGLAAKSQTLPMAQMHLHHVINCLVGPGGQGYDSSVADPCQGQGAGGIADTSGPEQTELKAMVVEAQHGLSTNDLKQTQQTGANIQSEISAAK